MKIPRIHVRAEAVHNKTVNAELRPLLNLNSMPLAATGACRSDGLGFRVIHNCEVAPHSSIHSHRDNVRWFCFCRNGDWFNFI